MNGLFTSEVKGGGGEERPEGEADFRGFGLQFGRVRKIHVLESAWDEEKGVLNQEGAAMVSRLGGIRFVFDASPLPFLRRLSLNLFPFLFSPSQLWSDYPVGFMCFHSSSLCLEIADS